MAGELNDYAKWLREQPCVMVGNGTCLGAVHVHHSPFGKGLGTRNHDETGKPLCAGHHAERHALTGAFKGWGKSRLKEWEREAAGVLRRLYLGVGEVSPF